MRKDVMSIIETMSRYRMMNISFPFFGGDVSFLTRVTNVHFSKDGKQLYAESEGKDRSETEICIDINDDMKINFDEELNTFIINDAGVTGILDRKIYIALF